MHADGVGFRNLTGGIRRVGRGTVEVEFCRSRGIVAVEGDVAVAAADIQSLLESERINLIADPDGALSLPYIEYSDLAAGGEMRGAKGCDGLQEKVLTDGHGPSDNHPVVHRVDHIHLVADKQRLDEEVMAQPCGVVSLCVNGV